MHWLRSVCPCRSPKKGAGAATAAQGSLFQTIFHTGFQTGFGTITQWSQAWSSRPVASFVLAVRKNDKATSTLVALTHTPDLLIPQNQVQGDGSKAFRAARSSRSSLADAPSTDQSNTIHA